MRGSVHPGRPGSWPPLPTAGVPQLRIDTGAAQPAGGPRRRARRDRRGAPPPAAQLLQRGGRTADPRRRRHRSRAGLDSRASDRGRHRLGAARHQRGTLVVRRPVHRRRNSGPWTMSSGLRRNDGQHAQSAVDNQDRLTVAQGVVNVSISKPSLLLQRFDRSTSTGLGMPRKRPHTPLTSVSHSVRIAAKSGANSRFSLAYSLTLPVTASWKR